MRPSKKLYRNIPKGMYCYTFTGKTSLLWNAEIQQEVTSYHIKLCPAYFRNKLGYGDCKYLVKKYGVLNGENNNLDFCLDDQCKACKFKK